jgi:negative regulator of genetic competence, sporulation and motility
LFVTKLGLSGQRTKKERFALNFPKAPSNPHVFVFAFEELEHLLRTCQKLRSVANDCCSSAWRDELGRYYLLLQEKKSEDRNVFIDPMTLAYIHEYAIPRHSDTTLLYIKEHATPICENNAIAQLSEL